MTRLIVLADTWGIHPSSCQHLVRRLATRFPTTWVNTIGMRRPQLSRADAAKIVAQLGRWLGRRSAGRSRPSSVPLTVIDPVMWPGFHYRWERRLNGRLLARGLRQQLRAAGAGTRGEGTVVLTTVPIAAALIDRIDADAWIYYCVDDFAAWPGLDGRVMRDLEQRVIARADRIVAASRELQGRIAAAGREATVLTHGVDLVHWRAADGGASGAAPLPWMQGLRKPIVLFWGLIDERLDVGWLQALCASAPGHIGSVVLVGPMQAPDAALAGVPGLCLPGALPYDELPRVAAAADVLVMPYRDTAVTRAMQPLKLTEYLATEKPVVMRDLPAVQEWRDAADVVDSAGAFVRAVCERARGGLPDRQRHARGRLIDESWDSKAKILEAIVRQP